MAEIERMTITLPADMAAVVKSAVKGGDYASTSEVVREALRDWKTKRALQLQELAALKAEIDKGLADLAEGRVKDFDADRIIERGRKLYNANGRPARMAAPWPAPSFARIESKDAFSPGEAIRGSSRGSTTLDVSTRPLSRLSSEC